MSNPVDAAILKVGIADTAISTVGNVCTITREYIMQLKDDFRATPNTLSTEMDVLSSTQIPADMQLLTGKPDTFYKNVNFYVTSRTAKMLYKASSSGMAGDERVWQITIVYTGEGILFRHLSTESVKILGVETGFTPYNFNVTKAYNHTATGDSITDEVGKPTKPVQNVVGDPLLEGLVEVRNIFFAKITLLYVYVGAKQPITSEWLSKYSNILNEKEVNIYGKNIPAFSGLMTIENYQYIQTPGGVLCRLTYNIQVKDTVNSIGGWIQQPVNQGFRAYLTSEDLAAGKLSPIRNKDLNESVESGANDAASDPTKLDDVGYILGAADPDEPPYMLQFIVQGFRDWEPLSLPRGQ